MDPIPSLNAAFEGRYRIERELGRGGMATVYLAVDLKHERRVAIKVLRPELGDVLGDERFEREIRVAARLSHPGIVSLIDSGVADGHHYYVMFYVEGESLRDVLDRETQLGVDEALRIARDVGEALAHAHDRGVVHRDVKPENVLLQDGHALVADFGIARVVQEIGGERLTHTGISLGTPIYMSPEQAAGDASVDERADVYSLATMLYEMLAGEPPFTGPTLHAILAKKSLEAPPGLRIVRPAVSEALEETIRKALSPTPADRQPSIRAFLQELESGGARGGGAGRATAGGSGGRLRLAGGVALAVVAAVAIARLGFRQGEAPPFAPTFTQLTSDPGVEDGACLSPDGEWVVYTADGGGDRDLFLRPIGGQNPLSITPDSPDDDSQPAFSPDGRSIAFRSERDGGGIFVMGRTGEGVRRVTDDGFGPAWSPDGTKLVYTLENVGITPLNMELRSDLWVVDVAGGEPTALGVLDGTDPSWSPGGDRIAYSSRGVVEGRLGGLDISTVPAGGGEEVHLTAGESNDWGPVWSADGRHVYFVSDRGGSMNLWRIAVDEASGRALAEPEPVTAPAQYVAHPCVAADGSGMVFSSIVTTAQNVQEMPFDPVARQVGEPRWLTRGSRRWANPDPSPDGERVALYTQDRPEGDLYIMAGDGSALRQLTGDSAVDRVPRWSPDGTAIAYFSTRGGALDVWSIRPDGSGNRQLTDTGAGVTAWSPDGARLAVTQPAFTTIIDAGAGLDGPIDTIPPPDASMGRFTVNAWSPDGRYLAGGIDYRDTGVVVYSFEDEEYRVLTDFGQWPVFLPDSRSILFVSGGNAFYVVDVETAEVEQIYSTPWDVIGPPRLTADATRMVFTRRVTEGDVWLARFR